MFFEDFLRKRGRGGTSRVSVEGLVSLSLTPTSSSPDLGPHHGLAPWASPLSVPQPLGAKVGGRGGLLPQAASSYYSAAQRPFPT